MTGFSNSVVIMMIGLFVVGGAIFQTGLAKMISSRILKLAGDSELKLFILIVLVTAFIGAFVSNTGTVALMLPIVVSMAMGTQIGNSDSLDGKIAELHDIMTELTGLSGTLYLDTYDETNSSPTYRFVKKN